jgi:MFS family permease
MSQKDQSFRLPPVVKALGWVSLLTDAAGDMVYPLIAPFLRSMGAGGAALGALEAISEGIGALVKWRSGAFADRVKHRKRLVVLGYVIATAARPLLSIAAAPWQVIALRSTDRIGKGVRSAPRDTILAAAIDPAFRAQAFGFHQMMDNLGAGVGPLLAFALAEGLGWTPRHIFAFAIVPGLLSLLVLIFGVHEPPVVTKKEEPVHSNAPLPGSVKRYLAALFVFTLGASADSFLLLRLSKLGLADALIPLAWLTLNVSKAATNMPGGRVSDRFGHKRTLVVAWTFYAAVYGLFPLMTTTASTWILMIVYGAYYGLSEGGEKAIVVELAPPGARGRALGAMHGLTGAGIVVANAAFGLLFEWSARVAFWSSASMALLGALGLAFLVPSVRKAG